MGRYDAMRLKLRKERMKKGFGLDERPERTNATCAAASLSRAYPAVPPLLI
jgi:hypothetical protein